MEEIKLRYGVNPHQTPARAFVPDGKLPFMVLSGAPGYINLLDALNSWQLVREMKELTGLPSAASFKHVSPAGAATGLPLSPELAESCFVKAADLSALATAYVRARGADRLASFGDWIALSDTVDESTAKVISREVSDGCIAPGYEPGALKLLQGKKNGTYPVLQMDPSYRPPEFEAKEVYGVTLEQARNNTPITSALLDKVVTSRKQIPDEARTNMLVATLALKYTQSNSVCVAYDGQVIGMGAGQQSRIACTRIACAKADKWLLRLHPQVRGLDFKKGTTRTDKANAIDLFLEEDAAEAELTAWRLSFSTMPAPLSRDERQEWLTRFDAVALSSDAFIPFRDNIDRAARSGVRYVVQTGGSSRDEGIIRAADEYGMVMAFTGLRLFHH
ncbi:phosphoribosylaminoimidazolecarboxamide formyltransferase [candidate division WOR-3 bacterium]|uniref:Phosphoribosylaminoimidazolecarboxamide formyltransferase n=1 Tax=candidate division WOR-3 bacterium TaxID=2052148 RepID=A0A937XF71_UNCW3|nr:phosphoribosylaminoimidazolecarboxamide formyltransferase [candidate division WOR-3 bacterium]